MSPQHKTPGPGAPQAPPAAPATEQPAPSCCMQKEVSLLCNFFPPVSTELLLSSSPRNSPSPESLSPGQCVHAGLASCYFPSLCSLQGPELAVLLCRAGGWWCQNPQGDNPRQIPADHSGITSRGTRHVHVKAQP